MGRLIFGSDIRVVVDAVVVAALDGLAEGAGSEGPPADSDEAVAAAYDADDDDDERPMPAPLPRCDRREEEVEVSPPLVEAFAEEFIVCSCRFIPVPGGEDDENQRSKKVGQDRNSYKEKMEKRESRRNKTESISVIMIKNKKYLSR